MDSRIEIRIALYSRKSKYTDKGDSVGNQIEIAKEYISLHYPADLYKVDLSIYEDEGFSAGTLNRPQFKKFLEDEMRNPFNVLICYRLDRISRNIADFSNLINELTKLETNFVSIKEQFDTTTPMGRAMMYIASVFAQLEREVIAERIRDNLLELAKTGIWLGGDPPLGFSSERYKNVNVCEEDNDIMVKKSKSASKLIINSSELPILKLIYYKYLELKSLSKLETYLMNNDIKTRKGAYYGLFSLKFILTNPIYVQNDNNILNYFNEKGIKIYSENDNRNKFDGKYGFLTYNKTSGKKDKPMSEWIVAVGLHPGIIPSKDWIAVQILLEKNADKKYRAAANPRKQTIVSGLLKCKICGYPMRPRNMDKRRPDGTVNYRYCCNLKERSRGKKCNCLNVSGEQLDNKIIEIIKETFSPNSLIYAELKKMANTKSENIVNDELEVLENEYENTKEEINNIVEKLKYIDIDLMDMINDNLRALKKRKKELENQINNLKTSTNNIDTNLEVKTSKDILKIIDNSFEIFDTFDLKIKRDITSLFIESMYGNGEDVEINFLNTKISDFQKKTLIPIANNNANFFEYTPANRSGEHLQPL